MFDYSGMAGANMIADRLSIYRIEDQWNRDRDDGQLIANAVAAQNRAASLEWEYNRLRSEHNAAVDLMNKMQAHIADQNTEIETLRAENQRLNERVQKEIAYRERVIVVAEKLDPDIVFHV